MKHVHLTWYLLVDGTQADPNDVAPDADGVLRNKNGMPVAMREDGNPQTIGVGAQDNKNVEAAAAGKEAVQAAEAMKTQETQTAQDNTTAAAPAPAEIDPATGQTADDVTAKEIVAEKPKVAAKDRQMKPAGAKKYKTR